MKTKAEVRETYVICCWCSEEFPDLKAYKDHYNKMVRKGDFKHDQWVKMYKDQKRS